MKALYTSLILAASLGLGACSQYPLAATFPLTYQQKAQAAHHWDVIAADVAQRLRTALGPADPSGKTQVLNVQGAKCCTVFNFAFHEFLITHLLEQGFGVSENPAAGLPVKYQVQLVTHKDRGFLRPDPGLLTGLASGVLVIRNVADSATPSAAPLLATAALDIALGGVTGGTPDNEIIITTSVMSGDRYLVRTSDIYYVSDNNRDQYMVQVQAAPPTRMMEVVGQ